ncbi:DUF2141 domain-containing protein [Sphingobium sp. AN641]|uniref:DUF2141 domain-containing protein n=1 Tax=Sphingobium sp. AN641 TaxID=3133443 RepID=UPI0030BB8EA7
MRAAIASLAALLLAAAPPPPADGLTIAWEGLRSQKGRILICVTRNAKHFPNCSDDPEKRHYDVAATAGILPVGRLASGDYAIAIIHDENGNGKLDTFMGIPREGVGFSRNAPIRFGPPGFRAASVPVADMPQRQTIRVKYFL